MEKIITIEENLKVMFEDRVKCAICNDYEVISANCGVVDGKTVYMAILKKKSYCN